MGDIDRYILKPVYITQERDKHGGDEISGNITDTAAREEEGRILEAEYTPLDPQEACTGLCHAPLYVP